MTTANAAVLWPDTKQLSIETLQLDDPRDDEVLVKLVASGICHTDIFLRDTGVAPRPVVLGHEGSGIVEKVGAAVLGYRPGDRVAISFASCGICPSCKRAVPAYCSEFYVLNFFGSRVDGTTSLRKDQQNIHSHIFGQSSFSNYAVCPVSNLVKVDEAVPLELAGPFGCGFQTGAGAILNSLKVPEGASVMVLGAGAVGLSAVMAASFIAKAEIVIAVDIKDGRLEIAKSVGATHTINGAAEDFGDQVRKICSRGVDFIVDTSGHVPIIQSSIVLLASQGTLGLVAAYPLGSTFNFDLLNLVAAGKKIQGVMEGDSDKNNFIPALMEHYKQGRFPVDKIVRYYDFADINEAMDASESGDTIKAIVRMP